MCPASERARERDPQSNSDRLAAMAPVKWQSAEAAAAAAAARQEAARKEGRKEAGEEAKFIVKFKCNPFDFAHR